jgi:hypothetical protein
MTEKCRVCSSKFTETNPLAYTAESGSVCRHCDKHDRDMWVDLKDGKNAVRDRRRNTLHNQIQKFKLEDRVKFINDGTVVFDNKYYYYCQKKKARVKGNPKQYQMRGFAHFLEVFLKVK